MSGDPGGVIGGKGDVTVQGNTVTNSGSMSADATLHVIGQSVDNGNGALHAGQTTTVDAGNHLSNAGGRVEGQSAVLNGATLDNSQGTVNAATVSLNGTTLLNHGGTVTQTGTGPMTVAITDTLDNSNNGLIQTRSTDLSLTSTTLINDSPVDLSERSEWGQHGLGVEGWRAADSRSRYSVGKFLYGTGSERFVDGFARRAVQCNPVE
ncbi:haemagglutinin [Burkholderia pseudomallei]|nr:haemagglutinin [Burkholderia pseudomallei]